jgi:hypothetical protein
VISITRPSFWELYWRLPEDARAQARAAFERFRENPFQAGLQFKKLAGYPDWWSARIGLHYRVIGARSGDTIRWFWIGSHSAYDKLIGR